MRAADPLRRRLREPVPVVRSLTLQSVSGHPSQRSKRAAKSCARPGKGGVAPETQDALDSIVIGERARRAPEEHLVSRTVPWRGQAGAAFESNRARSRYPYRARRPHRTCPRRNAQPGRRLSHAEPPAGGRRDRIRRWGTCEPNLSKMSTRDSRRRRGPREHPDSRERRASRRFARFSQSARRDPGVLLRCHA